VLVHSPYLALCALCPQAQLQKELELQASHAKNSAKRLQQLQVRYDSAQQRYESLKNSSMNGGDQRRDSAEPPARATSVDGSDAESTVRLDAALEALDRAKAEAGLIPDLSSLIPSSFLS
jgi:beta-glucosidase-like glycosyl hydrolase